MGTTVTLYRRKVGRLDLGKRKFEHERSESGTTIGLAMTNNPEAIVIVDDAGLSTTDSNIQDGSNQFAIERIDRTKGVQTEGAEGEVGQTEDTGGGSDDSGGGDEDDESEPPTLPRPGVEGGEIVRRFPTTLFVLTVITLLIILFNLTYLNVHIGIYLTKVNEKIIAAMCSIIALKLTFIYKVLLWLNGEKPRKEDKIDNR